MLCLWMGPGHHPANLGRPLSATFSHPNLPPQATLYKRMGSAMTGGERFQEATLAFFNMALFTGPLPPEGGIVPIDADAFLQQLRWVGSGEWDSRSERMGVFRPGVWRVERPSPGGRRRLAAAAVDGVW